MAGPALSKREFETLSEFRYRLRRFLRFSEQATRKHGITPLQYLLLLHLKGFPGRDWAKVGELAERLQAQHHGVVALVSRCEKLGWVTRRQGKTDRREVEIHLTAKGERIVTRMAQLHREEHLNPAGSFLLPELKNLQGD
ncbi:MAG: MarR family transcriptional regulator [Burkholderiaceae bacterium]|nr:MarR family transcriptional regulator [Sulfuritalea sp.]MCF8174810.1 MarR family transcriptional regulator [Burkholderiaceae bacterium]